MESVNEENERTFGSSDFVRSTVEDVSESDSSFSDETSYNGMYRHDYADPFEVNAAAVMSEVLGKQLRILSWPKGVVRLQDNIPLKCLKKDTDGPTPRRAIPLYKVADKDVILNVLMKHTHWGIYLCRMCKPGGDDDHSRWYQNLRRRIKSFIYGYSDPVWSSAQTESAYGPAGSRTPRETKHRVLRLLQLLQTIDGMFLQIYLIDMTVGWSWELFDNFVLGNIHRLIGDEFLDGELAENFDMSTSTNYERLKAYRGLVKSEFLNGKFLSSESGLCSVFNTVIEILNDLPNGIRKTQLGAILIQTRGCGTPPPFVVLKSKRKFLLTVSQPSVPLENGQARLIRTAMRKLIDEIPDHVFTGLVTKAGVHVTTSACIENLRMEGGSTEHVRSLVREGMLGRKVPIRDLETDGITGYENLETLNVGEYIFWRCLEDVLSMTPVMLRRAYLVMIKEPGKARTVTKAHAALKIVLDLVSGICSYPLRKVESSESGMGKSNHGWNFFTSLYTKWKELVFPTLKVELDGVSQEFQTTTFHDLFVGFTDYSEATDKMDHSVARIVSEEWMVKCGLPKLLRGIVHETCYRPREVFFQALGPIKNIGDALEPDTDINFIVLRKGVLMGDPLTKVILHLMNMITRECGRLLSEQSLLKSAPEFDLIELKRISDEFAL
jgi:hypothetical protein